jgi:FkbM family methyltransferase
MPMLRPLRSFARKALTEAALKLPPKTRRSVLEGLAAGADGEAYEIFQALGKSFGVRDIRVEGEYGLFEGAIADGGVMAGYAKAKSWASETNRLFVDFFGRHGRGTYIDIGAHIGLTTIPLARFPGVACKAFEPEPANFGYLARNVAIHCKHGNVELFNAALCDRNAAIDFELDVNNHGDHRIHMNGVQGVFDEQDRPVISVKGMRLDDALSIDSLQAPIGIKIDTQGAEGKIFVGGQALLGAADLVFFEYWPYSMARTGVDIDWLAAFLRQHFTAGSIVAGDHDEAPDWSPIENLIDRVQTYLRHSESEPFVYHEVYLRK